MKYISIFIVVFLLCSNFILISEEKNNSDKPKIEIIQESKSKFIFSLNNRSLTNIQIINHLKNYPEIQKKFIKANLGFIGGSVMLGFGIGFSPIFSATILASILLGTMINFNNFIVNIVFASFLSAGIVGLLGCLTIWIVGSFVRALFRIKEAEVIKIYNNLLEENKESNNEIKKLNSIECNKLLTMDLLIIKI